MPTVLVIDDDRSVRAAIEAILKRRNFGIFVSPDGNTGLGLFESIRFDVVIVDIFMPGMEGLATIRALRAINPRIPIIAISGHPVTARTNGTPDFLGMAVKLGANRSLQKPFRPKQLIDAITHCLNDAGQTAPAGFDAPTKGQMQTLSSASPL